MASGLFHLLFPPDCSIVYFVDLFVLTVHGELIGLSSLIHNFCADGWGVEGEGEGGFVSSVASS